MAKKKATKMQAVETKQETWAVRLQLDAADHEELERVAKFLRLSKAGFARMAIIERIRVERARMSQ